MAVGVHLGILLWSVATFLVIAVLAAVFHRRGLWLVYPACTVVAAAAAFADLSALLSVSGGVLVLPFGLPSTGLHLRLDGLSAFFGLIINVGVSTASIYGMGLELARQIWTDR